MSKCVMVVCLDMMSTAVFNGAFTLDVKSVLNDQVASYVAPNVKWAIA
jgi:hypothetical protein